MRNGYYYDAVELEDALQTREMPRKVRALHNPDKDVMYSYPGIDRVLQLAKIEP